MWLMDQLIDDYRLEEAEEYCTRFAQIDHSYRVLLYRGMIAWQRGEREVAFSIWAQMEAEHPEEWCVWHNIGDYLARSGRYDEAMDYYRKALDVVVYPLRSFCGNSGNLFCCTAVAFVRGYLFQYRKAHTAIGAPVRNIGAQIRSSNPVLYNPCPTEIKPVACRRKTEG